MARAPSKSRTDGQPVANIAGATVAPLPRRVEPELPSLAATPPAGRDWLHEIKLDGYRILASVEQGRATLLSRRGNDWTKRMPALAKAVQTIPVKTALLDGELVVLDERGVSDFQRLQAALGGARDARLVYFAFDLLYLNGVDLRGVGLVRRKALLAELLAHVPPPSATTLRLSDHVIGHGPAFLAQAARMGLEGIVSKQLDAPYRSGRSRSWLKMKCSQRQELVVVGFTDPKGSRTLVGALLLATHTGGRLVYRGRVGTGFSEDSLRQLHRKLTRLVDRQPALAQAPTGAEARAVHWVRPELVAEVSFSGLTQDGLLRHSIFLGLREDKSASEVVLEDAADATR